MYNVTNDSGEESYWSFAHDISERIRYEAQIKRLNQIMDTTINNLPAGIVVKEINNDFLIRYNKKSVSVLTDDGQRWTVAPGLLRPASADVGDKPISGNVVAVEFTAPVNG